MVDEPEDRTVMGDGSYADDLACAVGAAAESVLPTIQKVGCIAWRIYEECGFRFNWPPGKSAVKIRWREKTLELAGLR